MDTSEAESEEGTDSEGSSFDSSDQTTVPVQATPPQFVQKLIVFAAGLRMLLSAVMNTAGIVVVTILLGLAGTPQQLECTHPSYSVRTFHFFLLLIWCLTTLCCVYVYVCAGITLPSLTSGVYFGVFLGLVWWWVLSRPVGLLLFSSLCVMMAIFSGGHLLALYLYQLPLSQQLVPPEDVYARYRSD